LSKQYFAECILSIPRFAIERDSMMDIYSAKSVLQPGNSSGQFLQVLVSSFTLAKQAPGFSLHLDIDDTMKTIRDGAGKRELFSGIKPSDRSALKKILASFSKDKNEPSCHFKTPQIPLRFANGGVLPIVRLKGSDGKTEAYLCLFYREIFPIGWNIANGASDTIGEILEPGKIMLRELSEELLILNHKTKSIYTYQGNNQDTAVRSGDAFSTWARHAGTDVNLYRRVPAVVHWIAGPDSVSVSYGRQAKTTRNCFLNITPEDCAIELDRIAVMDFKDGISIYDGEEKDGYLLNRMIGLFKLSGVIKGGEGAAFIPDRIFQGGNIVDFSHIDDAGERRTHLEQLVRAEMSRLKNGNFLSETQIREWEHTSEKFDLCPISKVMVGRYRESGILSPFPAR